MAGRPKVPRTPKPPRRRPRFWVKEEEAEGVLGRLTADQCDALGVLAQSGLKVVFYLDGVPYESLWSDRRDES